MKKTVLILQNQILHYRKPVFNALARQYDITVLHSGSPAVDSDDQFKERIIPTTKLGPFYLQHGVISELGKHDVVIAMCDVRWIANAIAAFCRRPRRLVYWGHRYSRNALVNRLRDQILKRSDAILQYSDAENCRLRARGIPERKIAIAWNTIDVQNHADGSVATKDSFLFVGRAQKRKNVDHLICAFAEIAAEIPAGTLLNIVGEGPENRKLRDLACRLGVGEKVRFHGEVLDSEDLKRLFHSAYAYVSPGPVGLGAIHSLAYGVPIVTSRGAKHGPEFGALSNAENALIYDSPRELPSLLRQLCSQASLARQLGHSAYQTYAQYFTIDRMLQGFVHAIEGNSPLERQPLPTRAA